MFSFVSRHCHASSLVFFLRGIVSYTRQFQSEASAAHAAGIKYFLGETNSGMLRRVTSFVYLPT